MRNNMSNWCKNMTKPKDGHISLGKQFCNLVYDNCWKIIEFVEAQKGSNK